MGASGLSGCTCIPPGLAELQVASSFLSSDVSTSLGLTFSERPSSTPQPLLMGPQHSLLHYPVFFLHSTCQWCYYCLQLIVNKAVITSHLPSGSVVKNPPDHSGDTGDVGLIPELGRSPGGGMATHSSILARRIPWTEEPGGLQAMGSQRVRHDWAWSMSMHKQATKIIKCEWISVSYLFLHDLIRKSKDFIYLSQMFKLQCSEHCCVS